MFTNPHEIIEKLGGPGTVAARLNKPYTTVHSWLQRQYIPPRVWSEIVQVAREQRVKGLTFETLAALPRPKRRKAA